MAGLRAGGIKGRRELGPAKKGPIRYVHPAYYRLVYNHVSIRGGGAFHMLTLADMGREGAKNKQTLAEVICERSLTKYY